MKSISIITLTAALLLAGPSLAIAQDTSTQDSQDNCLTGDLDVTLPDLLAAIGSVETAQVIRLDGCSGTPDTSVIEALMANESIVRVLEQETVGAGEIIAVGSEDGNVTIYVTDDEE